MQVPYGKDKTIAPQNQELKKRNLTQVSLEKIIPFFYLWIRKTNLRCSITRDNNPHLDSKSRHSSFGYGFRGRIYRLWKGIPTGEARHDIHCSC